MQDSERKVIWITGASTGIGAATARRLAEQGWRLVLSARSVDRLEALVQELGEDVALAVPCDVTDFGRCEAAVARILEAYGRLDAVFANAGAGGKSGGFSAAPVESWRTIVEVNILGLAHSLQASLPPIKQARGHVIITGSIAGRRSLDGSMYSASKHAANAIGYNLRGELKGTGVRVCVIEPGMVDTPFFDDPKPHALRPDDVARSVAYVLEQPATVDVHELVILPTPEIEAEPNDG